MPDKVYYLLSCRSPDLRISPSPASTRSPPCRSVRRPPPDHRGAAPPRRLPPDHRGAAPSVPLLELAFEPAARSCSLILSFLGSSPFPDSTLSPVPLSSSRLVSSQQRGTEAGRPAAARRFRPPLRSPRRQQQPPKGINIVNWRGLELLWHPREKAKETQIWGSS